jgi:biopolymer transport protein ExbD
MLQNNLSKIVARITTPMTVFIRVSGNVKKGKVVPVLNQVSTMP